MNKVLAGDFQNGVILDEFDKLVISVPLKEKMVINAKTVKAYEVVTEESRKSASSSLVRGLVGGALLGGVGMVAGAVSGKNNDTYEVAVEFVDGKKTLLQLDGKAYHTLTKSCFGCGNATIEEANAENKKYMDKYNKKGGCAKAFFIVAMVLLVLTIIIIKVAK